LPNPPTLSGKKRIQSLLPKEHVQKTCRDDVRDGSLIAAAVVVKEAEAEAIATEAASAVVVVVVDEADPTTVVSRAS